MSLFDTNVLLYAEESDMPQVRSRLDFDEPFEVVQVTPAIMHAGVDLHPTRSIGYLDAIVLASAHTAGCDRLWTKDMNAGEMINAVRIVNPFLDV